MPRAPFQILVLPYRRTRNTLEYAVLRRSDYLCWQGVAGGGEDDETPTEAARREAREEAGISASHFTPLQSSCTVPVMFFQDDGAWDPALYVIPQYAFGADCTGQALTLSDEHNGVEWLPYAEASVRFTYDSNRTALWELNQRLLGLRPRGGDVE